MATAEKYYKEAGHDNFKLNIVNVIEEDIQTRLSTAFSAGVTDELPDIVLMGDSWANMYLTNFPGCYVDLTDEIDFSEFAPYKVSCFTVDGRVYGVPFDSGSAGLFYRTDILIDIRIAALRPGRHHPVGFAGDCKGDPGEDRQVRLYL